MKYIALFMILLVACRPDTEDLSLKARAEILRAESDMSAMAVQEGFHRALLIFGHDSLIKPEEGKLPIVGRQALDSTWAGDPGTKSISWKPIKAEASFSGDLGYTIGTWRYDAPDTTLFGTYYTIWRREADGRWKWVLDAGHNSPEPAIK